MGDFFKLERRAPRRERLRREERYEAAFDHAAGAGADSLLAAFGPLARGVLAVPPPEDAKFGTPGTARVDAYQEYCSAPVLSIASRSRPRSSICSRLSLDSTFALAHYKLSVAMHWEDTTSADSSEKFHALAAARLVPRFRRVSAR